MTTIVLMPRAHMGDQTLPMVNHFGPPSTRRSTTDHSATTLHSGSDQGKHWRRPVGSGPYGSPRAPLIETRSLTQRYPRVTALDELTVDVEPGIIGLVGANGAGKSTLIKILLGLLPADLRPGARCSAWTRPPTARQIRARVGYMPEHDCLPPDLSAAEFVTHMARMQRAARDRRPRARRPRRCATSASTRSATARSAATPPA